MPETDANEDFKYIVRIAYADLDGEKPIEYALTQIKGIGTRISDAIISKTGLNPSEKIGNLSDEEISMLEKSVEEISDGLPSWMFNRQHDRDTGDDLHIYSTNIGTYLRDDVNRLKKIRSYRGIRHERRLKVRGQRTRSNGRKGLSLGVTKKKGVKGK